jgi:hypothetical protein
VRTTSLVLSASIGAIVTLAVSTGTAWADPVPADPGTAPTTSPTASAVQEPGYVSVSVSEAAPGQTVRVSGTCPTPPVGAALPVVESVTSPAFAGPEKFAKTHPMAFDGTATIARSAAAGSSPVTLTCSNGTATTTFTVTNGGEPTPTPSHHGSSGTHGTAAGGDATTDTRTDGGVVVVVENQPVGVPWGWITTGVLVVFGGGAGSAYLLSRRGTRADENDSVSTPNEHLHV